MSKIWHKQWIIKCKHAHTHTCNDTKIMAECKHDEK